MWDLAEEHIFEFILNTIVHNRTHSFGVKTMCSIVNYCV